MGVKALLLRDWKYFDKQSWTDAAQNNTSKLENCWSPLSLNTDDSRHNLKMKETKKDTISWQELIIRQNLSTAYKALSFGQDTSNIGNLFL